VGPLKATVRTGTEWFPIDNAAATGSVRRAAMNLATRLGMGENRVAEVGIVASEAASNLAAHADHAAVGLQVALRDGQPGVQLVAIDRGPGMADLALSGIDGNSTSGTLGLGLGAMRRLSTSLDINTNPGRGTVLVAGLWASPTHATTVFDVGGVTRPMAGEEVCGDAIADKGSGSTHLLLAVDGLGHGPLAAAAAQEALTAFYSCDDTEPRLVMTYLHRRLGHTRGAAAAVVALDSDCRTARIAGIGNISAYICDDRYRRAMSSSPGIVGHQTRTIRQFDFELLDDSIVVLHSDGLQSKWGLSDTPGLSQRSPALIAASLLRDAGTKPDDASVLVARRSR
jgi:anti-sigma regulatory factor (Ser/Thr protein kinase)